ncbi:MAG: hypothetical protein EBZ78_08690 [Verrucomicrobia bacterium]|nr:hypothetical protein [Verrucomicrobiota bacterium]
MVSKKSMFIRTLSLILANAFSVFVVAPQVHAQNLISNGGFADGLAEWTTASWAGGSSFGLNANGPTDTSAASGNYAYAGGGYFNLLQQSISGVTSGGNYRLTFQVGSKS